MSDSSEFGLIGLEQLMAKIDSVTDDVKRRGGRSSLRKAAMVIVNAAKQKAESFDDKETGQSIAGNVALRWNGREYRQTGNLAFRIGVLKGAVLKKDGGDTGANTPTPHWRLKEFGAAHMAADPFMRPALANNIGSVTDTFVREYEKAIDRAIKRAAR